MRYLSDDGKVFNYEEECIAHEKEVKEAVLKKERETQMKKEMDALDIEYDSIINSIQKWLKKSIEFENKYHTRSEKPRMTFDEFMNFIF